jgi:hypothetical protein
MLLRLKSYLSVFFLVAFLFPTLVKEVHTVNHEKRFHCDAKGEKHLHAQHHDCSLCDFVLPIASSPAKSTTSFTQFGFAEYIFPRPAEFYFSSSHFSSAQLRAPPVQA